MWWINHNLPSSCLTLLLSSHCLHNQDAKNYWSPKITYIKGLDMLHISRVADNLVEPFAIRVCNTKYHNRCPIASDIQFSMALSNNGSYVTHLQIYIHGDDHFLYGRKAIQYRSGRGTNERC
jgi:hypothetical protein